MCITSLGSAKTVAACAGASLVSTKMPTPDIHLTIEDIEIELFGF